MSYGVISGQTPVPSGLISLWYGSVSNIPGGWTLCNGQNGTPDLRDKFIVGAGNSYNPGDTGGSDTVVLTANNLPSHNHSLSGSTVSAGSHTHTVSEEYFGASVEGTEDFAKPVQSSGYVHPFLYGSRQSYSNMITIDNAGSHTHTLTGNTGDTGNNEPHENRPPYYALCYIMKL